jgi:flagellar export protein FliJ
MKAFRFTLEAVATTRRQAENVALENYAQALLLRANALRQLELAQRELDGVWGRVREEMAHGSTAAKVAQLQLQARLLEEDRTAREEALAHAERGANQALQQMLAARRRREAVDKLRGRQRLSYDRDIARDSQKFLDELATQRAVSASSWRVANDSLV